MSGLLASSCWDLQRGGGCWHKDENPKLQLIHIAAFTPLDCFEKQVFHPPYIYITKVRKQFTTPVIINPIMDLSMQLSLAQKHTRGRNHPASFTFPYLVFVTAMIPLLIKQKE